MIKFLKAFKDELVKRSDLVVYSSGKTPKKYKCAKCKVTGVKLWREYQTFSPQLLCADCAVKDQKKNYVVNADGKVEDEHGDRSDQIGWYVPAVPDEEGAGYWGYTSVPQEGVNWWKQLPTRK